MPQSPQNAKRAANPAVIYNPLHTSGDEEVEPHPPALHEKGVLGSIDIRKTTIGIGYEKTLLLVCAVLISNLALAAGNKEEVVPVRISCPNPYYPVSAMANRISGTVNYAASVNEKGSNFC